MTTDRKQLRCAGSPGISLIELMTVVGLIGIFSMIAFSSLQPFASQFRVNGAAAEVLGELSRARLDATRTGLCHWWIPFGSNQFRIIRDNAAAPNCVREGGDTVVRTINLSQEFSGVSFGTGGATTNPYGAATADATPTEMRFEPRGVVTGTGGTSIFISALDAKTACVTVSAAGAVRSWTRNSGGGWQ